jgi:hypothetical protein
VLQEVEEESEAEAATGDVEAAAHHAYERHLADASGKLEGISALGRKAAAGIVIGGAIGIGTAPIAGPLGIVASTGVSVALATITDVRTLIRQRRSRGWVSVHHKIMEVAG